MKKKMNIGTLGASLSRGDMRKIMAGSGGAEKCKTDDSCPTGCWCNYPAHEAGCCRFACCIAG